MVPIPRRRYANIVERLAEAPAAGARAAGELPAETLYLPFAAGPHRLAMGLVPLASGRFEIDALYPAEMALRRELIDRCRSDVMAALPGSQAACREVLDLVARELPARHPSWFERKGQLLHNRLTGETWDVSTPVCDPLELAGRLVQEDLCLLQPGPDGPVLSAAILCFPSRWRLADKLARGIAAIHAPVPGFVEALAAPVGRLLARLEPGQVVGRLNWSLAEDSSLHQPDGGEARTVRAAVTPATAGRNLYLRVERQTSSRLPASGAVLFAIRVHVYPLEAAITSPVTALRLAGAVRALPDDLQRYKRFLPFRDALLAWLDAQT